MNAIGVRGYKDLARLVANLFYSGKCPPDSYKDPEKVKLEIGERPERKGDSSKVDTTGLACLIINTLTSQEWVNEENLASEIDVSHKQLRRALRYLQEEQILMREHRKETKRTSAKDIVVQMTKQEKAGDDEPSEAPPKANTVSYCAIDYPGLTDMVQLRLHMMEKLAKVELEDSEPIQTYVCASEHCQKEYTSLDAIHLADPETGEFKCEFCGGNLQRKISTTGQTGDEQQRRARRKRMRTLLEKMRVQHKPLHDLIRQLQSVEPPAYGKLHEWAHREQQRRLNNAARASGKGGGGGGGGSRGGEAQDIDIYTERTEVEVNLGAAAAAESGPSTSAPKPPPRAAAPSWFARKPDPGASDAGQAADAAPQTAAAADEAARVKAYYEALYAHLYSQQMQNAGAEVKTEVKAEVKTEDWGGAGVKREPEDDYSTGPAKRIKTEDGGEMFIKDEPDIKVDTQDDTTGTPAPDFHDDVEWETVDGVDAAEADGSKGGDALEGGTGAVDGLEEDDIDWEDVS